jgi:hypothetical protein
MSSTPAANGTKYTRCSDPKAASQMMAVRPSVASTASRLAASRYNGASSARRKMTRSSRVTAAIASPTRHRSDAVALIASAVTAVWPPTSYRTPDDEDEPPRPAAAGPASPAARPRAGSRALSVRTSPIAVASSGSES